MKILTLFTIMGLSVGLCACNNGTNSTTTSSLNSQNSTQTKIQAWQSERKISLKNNAITPPRLGYGFDSRTDMANTRSCMANSTDPAAIKLTNPIGKIDFGHSVSSAEMASLLNAGISGGADFGLFSASVSGSYLRENSDNRYRASYNYAQIVAGDATYDIPGYGKSAMNSSAQEALNDGNDAFTTYCGDSVITAAKMGAVLLSSVSIEFASAHQKEIWDAHAGGSMLGLGGISSSFHEERETSTRGAVLTVSVMQLGGDPSKLANILGSPDPVNGYFITRCTTNDQSGCNKMIDAVIKYAQTDFQNGININTPQTNMYTFDTQETMYRDIGVKAELPVLSPEEKSAKNYLVTQIEADRKMLAYLTAYQKQSFYTNQVDSVSKDNTAKALKDYSAMVNDYNNFDIIYACYGSLNNINNRCVDAANNVLEMHFKYKTSIDYANKMANVIVINSPIGTLKFITINAGDNCDLNTNECTGWYSVYNVSTNKFLEQSCLIDTTFDNRYFKQHFPEYIGSSVFCGGNINGVDQFSVVRAYANNSLGNVFGNAWHVVNGQKIEYPLQPSGYNVQFNYSGAKDFLYNPI